jgi:DNA-binding NtrC family response regulator
MPKTVMIVDDHSSVGDMLGQMLAILGYQAKVFSSPSASLEWLNTDQPHMALLDIRMPGIDGVSLLEEFRLRGYKFPVVAITGYPSDDLVREAREMGAVAVAAKPVTMELLSGLVQLA